MADQSRPGRILFRTNDNLSVPFTAAAVGILMLLLLIFTSGRDMAELKGSGGRWVFWILTLSGVASSIFTGLRLQPTAAPFAIWMRKCFRNYCITATIILLVVVIMILSYNRGATDLIVKHLDMLIYIPVSGAVCALVTVLLLRKDDD